MKGIMRLFLKFHVFVYRLSGGKVMGQFGENPVLLLNSVGRKSGQRRTSPLLYATDGNSYLVAASNAGAANHPGWYFNLKHAPETTVEVKGETIPVMANLVGADERPRLWAKLVAMSDQYQGYADGTSREIPLFLLTPR